MARNPFQTRTLLLIVSICLICLIASPFVIHLAQRQALLAAARTIDFGDSESTVQAKLGGSNVGRSPGFLFTNAMDGDYYTTPIYAAWIHFQYRMRYRMHQYPLFYTSQAIIVVHCHNDKVTHITYPDGTPFH